MSSPNNVANPGVKKERKKRSDAGTIKGGKYGINVLKEQCEMYNIILLKEYTTTKKDTFIEGKCIKEDCPNNFNKSMEALLTTKAYCSTCATQIGLDNREKTNMLNYGCKNVAQNPEVAGKISATKKEQK
jgi:hypothetical protein